MIDRDEKILNMAVVMQVVIGIGAKPAVGPFERIGLNSTVGGIQVRMNSLRLLLRRRVSYKKYEPRLIVQPDVFILIVC